MAKGGEEQRIQLAPCGRRPRPFNSKQFTVAYMQQPTCSSWHESWKCRLASSDDVRQMIEGKLQEIGREPANVQVIVQQESGGSRVHLSLQDAEGVFLEERTMSSQRTLEAEL